MRRVLSIAIFFLAITIPLWGQMRQQLETRQRKMSPPVPTETLAPYSPSPRGLYHPSMTWYEFLLHQLNPHDRDYGAWYRERRQALVDASIRNPYFWHSFWVSLALIFLTAVLIKSLYDRRKEKRIMGEMMDEVRAHDAYSRQVAHEAIRRYNQHIELCNRAIESSDAGQATAFGGDSALASLKAERDDAKEKVSGIENDKRRLEAEVAEKTALITALSLRVDSLSRQMGTKGDGAAPSDVSPGSHADLVRHINTLEQQLYAEREKNKRLKGGL